MAAEVLCTANALTGIATRLRRSSPDQLDRPRGPASVRSGSGTPPPGRSAFVVDIRRLPIAEVGNGNSSAGLARAKMDVLRDVAGRGRVESPPQEMGVLIRCHPKYYDA